MTLPQIQHGHTSISNSGVAASLRQISHICQLFISIRDLNLFIRNNNSDVCLSTHRKEWRVLWMWVKSSLFAGTDLIHPIVC